MSERDRGAPLPAIDNAAGDPELLIEALACLILRGDGDAVTIPVQERLRTYQTFRSGFALMVFDDIKATGALQVTIVGEQAIPMMHDLADDIGRGRVDTVPEMFRPTPGGPTPGGNEDDDDRGA
jgi:hypothetical protein